MTLINISTHHDSEVELVRLGGQIADLALVGAGKTNIARLVQVHTDLGALLRKLNED